MSRAVNKIVIVGGGSAGWLSAAIIAAQHNRGATKGLDITLVESSDIPTVGVGEGTWPTMKNTLREIGIKESDFFRTCFAGFKQGGKFVNWVTGDGDFYYHPFTVPLGYGRIDLAPYLSNIEDYAAQTNFQHHVCEAGLAPRGLADNEYQGQCNYAYHLDAGAFADLLKRHCKDNLQVTHVVDTVEHATLDSAGNIESVVLQEKGALTGDLFIDCTGFASRLLGQTLNVPFISAQDVLFNDRALAMQVPYESDQAPVTCHTVATGQKAGWMWDIGLTNRRGIGHTYSSKFISDDEAEQILRDYVGPQARDLPVKRFAFESGHRQQFWKNNCVAVGLSAGFVDPLEATALMLIEISARFIAQNIPADDSLMPIVAKRFNEQMQYRWRRIIDFLKLHYMLSKRPEPYWRAHCDESTWPDSLKEDLAMWKFRGPVTDDFDAAIELFPAASYQYVLYGMGFAPDFSRQAHLYTHQEQADKILTKNQQITQQMLQSLPPHRQYIQQWLANSQ